MRFQALMPDILHWLGIKKIDRMLSMSNMKHDAIVAQGIKILERVPIPEGIFSHLLQDPNRYLTIL
jgi:GTP cyclohydrolase II